MLVGVGGIADLFQVAAIKESFSHFNFPVYMLPFFGIAKLAGNIAILIRSQKTLNEWAYAGLIFYFVGATYVHIVVGDGFDKIGVTLFILLVTTTSYVYSKKVS